MERIIDDAIGLLNSQNFVATKVDIVAHSMGGLITRKYCNDNYGECVDHIRKLITIDTPHRGSELADLLVIFRDHGDLFPNPNPWYGPSCLRRIRLFVEGGRILGMRIPAHPIGTALDDLASGRWAEPPFAGLSSGAWTVLPGLGSETSGLNVHTIVGVAAGAGHNTGIKILWDNILEPCGFPRARVFPLEPDANDRIVTQTSQQGFMPLPATATQQIDNVDHLSILENADVVSRVRELLDKKTELPDFLVGQPQQ